MIRIEDDRLAWLSEQAERLSQGAHDGLDAGNIANMLFEEASRCVAALGEAYYVICVSHIVEGTLDEEAVNEASRLLRVSPSLRRLATPFASACGEAWKIAVQEGFKAANEDPKPVFDELYGLVLGPDGVLAERHEPEGGRLRSSAPTH